MGVGVAAESLVVLELSAASRKARPQGEGRNAMAHGGLLAWNLANARCRRLGVRRRAERVNLLDLERRDWLGWSGWDKRRMRSRGVVVVMTL